MSPTASEICVKVFICYSHDDQELRKRLEHPDLPFTGLNGPVVFDSNGDNTMMRTLAVYAIENGQWTYKQADSVDLD
jgi:hypothetical protein